MYESYANVLESYVIYDIAEEGFGDAIKKVGSKAVEILKGLKDRIVVFFKKIAAAIRGKKTQSTENNKPQQTENVPGKRLAGDFDQVIRILSGALGDMSKAIGNSKTSNNSDSETVQSYITSFNNKVDHALEELDDMEKRGYVTAKEADTLIKHAESVKNTFVQEVDLAIKIISSAHYSMAQNATHTSSKLASQICSGNSKFLRVYSQLLNMINASTKA